MTSAAYEEVIIHYTPAVDDEGDNRTNFVDNVTCEICKAYLVAHPVSLVHYTQYYYHSSTLQTDNPDKVTCPKCIEQLAANETPPIRLVPFYKMEETLKRMAEQHIEENPGHNVWVHVREMDIHFECFTCSTDKTKEKLADGEVTNVHT